MPRNHNGNKVAEFTDTSGRKFIVIESNGIRFIQELTIVDKPHEKGIFRESVINIREVIRGKERKTDIL